MMEITIKRHRRNLSYEDAATLDELPCLRWMRKFQIAELIEAGDSIPGVPYANPAYAPIRPLKHEYRKRLVQMVQNYAMFYWVDEGKKLVTAARVIYAKRDFERLLE